MLGPLDKKFYGGGWWVALQLQLQAPGPGQTLKLNFTLRFVIELEIDIRPGPELDNIKIIKQGVFQSPLDEQIPKLIL